MVKVSVLIVKKVTKAWRRKYKLKCLSWLIIYVWHYSAYIYLFKVNNRNTRTICEIYSKLPIKTPEQSQLCFQGWLSASKSRLRCIPAMLFSLDDLSIQIQNKWYLSRQTLIILLLILSLSVSFSQFLQTKPWILITIFINDFLINM